MRLRGEHEPNPRIARLTYQAVAFAGIAGLLAVLAAVPLMTPPDALNVNAAGAEELAVAFEVEPVIADRFISERERIRGFASVAAFARTPVISPIHWRKARGALATLDINALSAEKLATALDVPRVLAQRLVADRASRVGGTWRSPGDVLSTRVLDPSVIEANRDRLIVRPAGAALAAYLLCMAVGLGSVLTAHWIQRRLVRGGDAWLLGLAAIPSGLMLALSVGAGDPLRDELTMPHAASGLAASSACYVAFAWLFGRKRATDVPRGSGWALHAAALLIVWLVACLTTARGRAFGVPGLIYLGPLLAGYSLATVLRHLGAVAPDRTRTSRSRRAKPFERHLGLVAFGVSLASVLIVFLGSRSMGSAMVTGLACALLMFTVDLRLWSALVVGITGIVVWIGAGLDSASAQAIRVWGEPWTGAGKVPTIAHALWGLASGGPFGSGLGLGRPFLSDRPPALAALAEELGVAGVLLVLLAIAALIWRTAGAAVRGCSDRDRLLAAATGCVLSSQAIIAGFGELGLLPLLDVHLPFASASRVMQIIWFGAVGAIAGLTANQTGVAVGADRLVFRRRLGEIVSGVAVVLLAGMGARTAWIQTFAADRLASLPVKVRRESGQVDIVWNPRLSRLAASVERGSILDGYGRILATSRLREIHAAVPDDARLARRYFRAGRYYPYGEACAGVLGVWTRSHGPQGGVEEQMDAHLRGYQRLAELLPLYRTKDLPRWMQPGDLRGGDVVLSINAVLQEDAHRILRKAVAGAPPGSRRRAAIVVLNAVTGAPIVSAGVPSLNPNEILLGRRTRVGPGVVPLGVVDHARSLMAAPPGPFKIASALAFDADGRSFETDCAHTATGLTWSDAGFTRTLELISDDPMDHAHGRIGMKRALKLSCNIWFARLAVRLGADQSYARMSAAVGKRLLPPRDEFGRRLPEIAAGTAGVWMSAMDMASITARAVAGSSPVCPTYWRELRFSDGRRPVSAPLEAADSPNARVHPATREIVKAALTEAVEDGPASDVFSSLRVRVAGKSASVPPARGTGQPDAWFVGCAPVSAPRFAIACWIEQGGSGLRSAAPVVRDMLTEMTGP